MASNQAAWRRHSRSHPRTPEEANKHLGTGLGKELDATGAPHPCSLSPTPWTQAHQKDRGLEGGWVFQKIRRGGLRELVELV